MTITRSALTISDGYMYARNIDNIESTTTKEHAAYYIFND